MNALNDSDAYNGNNEYDMWANITYKKSVDEQPPDFFEVEAVDYINNHTYCS